jgi:S1-C subfamily serine protease
VIDLALVAVLIGYAVSGYRQGLVVGVLSLGGFVGGSLLAMWVVPNLAAGLQAGVQRSLIVLVAVLVMAWLGQFVGSLVGVRLRDELFEQPGAKVDQALGAVAGVVAVSMVMWFVGGALRGGPSPVLARAVADSRVLTTIDRVMPDRLVGLANTFRGVVAGTSFPRVFAGVGREDILPVDPPDASVLDQQVLRTVARSIVKITGAASCDRGQEGSGAVVAPERVVTNAHVVAGVRRPTVQVGGTGRRYDARVVAFDPRRDVAVLDVPGLPAPALRQGSELKRGDSAVVAGFPNNGPFQAGAARVRSVIRASGEDIYGGPGVIRRVYALYAQVEPGNSGGPVIAPDGTLVGVVFAKSLDDGSTGYALTLSEVEPVIQQGVASSDRVSTEGCAAG